MGLKESSWVVRLWYAWFSPWFEAGYAYKRYAYKKKACTPLSVIILLILSINLEINEEHKLDFYKSS